jgi:hypothetical protein
MLRQGDSPPRLDDNVLCALCAPHRGASILTWEPGTLYPCAPTQCSPAYTQQPYPLYLKASSRRMPVPLWRLHDIRSRACMRPRRRRALPPSTCISLAIPSLTQRFSTSSGFTAAPGCLNLVPVHRAHSCPGSSPSAPPRQQRERHSCILIW